MNCISGSIKYAGNYAFVKAEDVETLKEDGSVEIDKEKIKELAEAAETARSSVTSVRKKAIYALKTDGEIQKYKSSAQAARECGVTPAQVSYCISGRNKTTCGYVFIPSPEIETRGKDGKVRINYKKVEDILKSRGIDFSYTDVRKDALYVFDKEGRAVRYSNSKEAAQHLGIEEKTILSCINGSKNKTSNNYMFVSALEIESVDECLDISIDEEKMKNLKNKAKEILSPKVKKTSPQAKTKKQSNTKYGKLGKIYALKPSGDYLEFDTLEETSIKLGIDEKTIHTALTGNNISRISGFFFTCDLYS